MIRQESGEMYLETIYRLSQSLPVVRSIDVSEYIGYSKPSVSRAIGILKKQEYITVDKLGAITLTDKGRERAQYIFERHKCLTKSAAAGFSSGGASRCFWEHARATRRSASP